MADINFQLFRIKHLAWKTRLKSFLEGKGGLTEEQAISHRECGLGKWLYSGGFEKYKHIPEMVTLEKVHESLHTTVRLIVSLQNAGRTADAEREFQKISPISQEIVTLLTVIEEKVKTA